MSRPKLWKNYTKSEKMVMMIEAMGYVSIPSKNRYKMFHKKVDSPRSGLVDHYLFVGKNGAVRANTNSKNAANSISLSDTYDKMLEKFSAKKEGEK